MSFLLKLQLSFALIAFFVQILLEHLKEVRVLLFSTLLLSSTLCLMAITVLSKQPAIAAFPLQPVISTSAQTYPVTYSLDEYNQQLTQYLTLLAVQPTHRDLLINTSLLYQAQQNTAKAEELWLAAQQLDPNHPIFSQE